MKQHILCLLLCLGLFLPAAAQKQLILTIANSGDSQRHEVVETPVADVYRLLDIQPADSFVVRNALGQQVGYQITHDGLLLLECSVVPHGQAVYTITTGRPTASCRPCVFGACFAMRMDDMAWENDRCAYRLYGPAVQRSGEQLYGIDVWTKSVPYPVLGERYQVDYESNVKEDLLRRSGRQAEADSLDLLTSIHYDHGNGMDAYNVGPTLGCGAPALIVGDSLRFPNCYTDCEILDNGPLRFTAVLHYRQRTDGIVEHRRLSLNKGSHFNRMTVWYDGIDHPLTLAPGVVLHDGGAYKLEADYVLHADPTDCPEQHQSIIFVAVLFPEGVASAECHETPVARHALGLVSNYRGAPYTYYFGASWSNYDVPTLAHWQQYVADGLYRLRHPLSLHLNTTSEP